MDSQRPILYLSFLFVLFLIYTTWMDDQQPKPDPLSAAIESTDPILQSDSLAANGSDIPETGPSASIEASDKPAEPTSSLNEKYIRVTTDVLDIYISTRGGTVVTADLLNYPVSLEENAPPVRILDQSAIQYVAQSGLQHSRRQGVDTQTLAPTHHAMFNTAASEYVLAEGADELRVPFTWTGANGIQVTKTFVLKRGDYLINVEQTVNNASSYDWAGSQYRQLRQGMVGDSDGSDLLYTFTGAAYYTDHMEKVKFDDIEKEKLNVDINGGWVAMLQHYFFSAWIPDVNAPGRVYTLFVNGQQPEYIIGVRGQEVRVAPNTQHTFTSQLWVGPKLQEVLDKYDRGLELTADYGIFSFLSKPLFWVLYYIHQLLGNWGWSILAVTVLIKLAFYPLSASSYRSMAKMKALTPKIQALKERYGDDRQGMGQAQMDLFKKEKVNPLGGCIPILLQIPVFISFYWMLLEAVELRHTPWILWIDDLSAMDPYFVLPVLMGVSMFVQQKLNPPMADPMQQKIMMILPLVMTFFFAFFPSGLVLYWVMNNILSIAQQWRITRQIAKQTK